MSEEPKIDLTDEQWDFIKGQELRRTEAANQVHREAMRLLAAQATYLSLQETRRMEEKRDTFAGQALANAYTHSETSPSDAARWAYDVADAMLEIRSTGGAA